MKNKLCRSSRTDETGCASGTTSDTIEVYMRAVAETKGFIRITAASVEADMPAIAATEGIMATLKDPSRLLEHGRRGKNSIMCHGKDD